MNVTFPINYSPADETFENALLCYAADARLPEVTNKLADVMITNLFPSPVDNCNKRKRDPEAFSSYVWPLNEDLIYPIIMQVNEDKNAKTLRSLSCVNKDLDRLCKRIMSFLWNQSLMNWRSDSFALFTVKTGEQILKIDFSLFSNYFLNNISDKDCETILRQCPNLQDVRLVQNKLTDDLIKLISSKIHLERLAFNHLTQVSSEKIQNLIKDLAKLNFIKFENCLMVGNPVNILLELSECKSIKKIEIQGVDFRGFDFELKGKENVDPVALPLDDKVSKRALNVERIALHLDRFTFAEGTKKILEEKFKLTLENPASSRKPSSTLKLQRVTKKLFNI